MLKFIRFPLFLIAYASLLSTAPLSVAGDVYKSIDAAGNVIYTDTPPAVGAEPIDLPEPSTYSPVNTRFSTRTNNPTPRKTLSYDKLTINTPAAEETFRATSVTISATASPGLQGTHMAQFTLDGKPIGAPSKSLTASATDLTRGSHTVTVQIVDETGKVIKSASGVTFYVQRAAIGR